MLCSYLCCSIFISQAGIIEEMMEDTFESMEDGEDMEEEAEAEVDKILFEITAGKQIIKCITRNVLKLNSQFCLFIAAL